MEGGTYRSLSYSSWPRGFYKQNQPMQNIRRQLTCGWIWVIPCASMKVLRTLDGDDGNTETVL